MLQQLQQTRIAQNFDQRHALGNSVVAGSPDERVIAKRNIELGIHGQHRLRHAAQDGFAPRKLRAKVLEHLFDFGSHARERTLQLPQIVIADIKRGGV